MNLEPKTPANNSDDGSKKRKHSSSASKKSGSKHQCCCKRYKKANGKSIHQHYKPKSSQATDKSSRNEPVKYHHQPVPVQCQVNSNGNNGGGISWSQNDTNCSTSEFDAGFFEGIIFYELSPIWKEA